MSCVEKRHMNHRVGGMLHHRFPNGFADLLMDETDREVSTLTDRAFRSLCVGDDAVYNDEFSHGYSPFSCHKPVVAEPPKKTHHKESKKQGQNKTDKNNAGPWKQQQQKNMSNMSSFLKALSVTKESCEGMLINGGVTDSNGESWDKSALRSIRRELSEFSSGYHTNLSDGHYNKHHQHDSQDAAASSGKSSKIRNGKSTVKLKKLNIKNFFLHSEFSPFQIWSDFNRFPFGREDASILPTDNIPKWYDLTFYKELTEAHTRQTQHTEETLSYQKAAVEPPPPPSATKLIAPTSPPKVLPKPSAAQVQKRCSSDGVDGYTAPWRLSRSRAKSAIPVNPLGMPPQDNCLTTVDESLLLVKNKAQSVEVKAIEEVSSCASTPFSICQLMTPLIPSRQPTETSEILQAVWSPSALDLPLRPHSEAKLTPEPPVKRESYKSLASSILFNLKDNRKRVKSRYSPSKFKTFDTSPQSDLKHPQTGSDGNASGFSTPAVLKDGQAVYSPALESISVQNVGVSKHDADKPLSEDYLLSNLLQSKREAAGSRSLGEEKHLKQKSPNAKKQNYPSLNLYKKASRVDDDMKYLQVPLSTNAPVLIDQPLETNELSPLTLNKQLSPKGTPTNAGLSHSLNINNVCSPLLSPHALERDGLSSSAGRRPPHVAEKAKYIKDKYSGAQPVSTKEKDQHMSTEDVIRAAREAINAAKNKALVSAQSEGVKKPTSDVEGPREARVEEISSSRRESSESESNVSCQRRNEATADKNVRKEPPPVPKRTFAKADIQGALDERKTHITEPANGDLEETQLDLPAKESVVVRKQGKHVFSARQNNYIKCQRYTVADDERGDEEGDLRVNTRTEKDEETASGREMRDSEHIINDLNALKELERARLSDRAIENGKNKVGVINIEEEARAKNDLISRELRSIKKGMLSMRGNTSAKREIFAKKEKEKEKEQCLQEAFTKIDSNVKINKALINENYDRAKMALEEIISDRQIRRNTAAEQDTSETFGDESFIARVQQSKKALNDSMTEAQERQNGSSNTGKDLRERLGDLRDHNHIRQILSQTEPRLGETHRSGGRIALPGMDKVDDELHALLKNKAKRVSDKLTDNPAYIVENSEVASGDAVRRVSEDTVENQASETESKKLGTPSVPPRNKKGGNRRHDVVDVDVDVVEMDIFDKVYENGEVARPRLRTQDEASSSSTKEALPSRNEEMRDEVTEAALGEPTSPMTFSQFEKRLSSELNGNETGVNPLQTDVIATVEARGSNMPTKRRAPLHPDCLIKPDDSEAKSLAADRASDEVRSDKEAVNELPRNIISPLVLVNGVSITQSPPDQASLSSKSSYFSVESAPPRYTEAESNVYQSLENLIAAVEGVDDAGEKAPEDSKRDSSRPDVEYYYLSDRECEAQKEEEVPHMERREIVGGFLTVPQEEDRLSGLSPSSEGVESFTTSAADTADEMVMNAEAPSEVPSEHSGSICSGTESQTGPPKPPAVLPKSEKAVLKAMKLTTRRMKKEETKKTDQSSSKHKSGRHQRDKSESKSSRHGRSGEKKHNEKTEDHHRHNESHLGRNSNDRREQQSCERRSHGSEKHPEMGHKTRRQIHESVESSRLNEELPSAAMERRGRSSNRHTGGRPEQRHYSSDRVISNVPVYRELASERVNSDRPYHRSQSIDRCSVDKVERRLSSDISANDKLDLRSQRIEKSIMDELQQRGRPRDKTGRDNPPRRSHSIDACTSEVPHPSTLSRQSSHTSQLSRQSSIEHTIVTQSFPMTQRKLLQDPESGQYFFVDMPVQVKTKTFFDPETRNYVQLPVQPPEGAILQASPMEVLTPPLMVYHSFVPVPLSPMVQQTTIQGLPMEPEELRHLERSRQMHCKEGHPYLEPVFGQHEHMLGEFLGTEELECPS